jgi:hypothetical protein
MKNRLTTSSVDDDAQDDEAGTRNDLDHTDNELDFAIASDTKILDRNQGEQEWANPSSIVNAFRAWPVVDDVAGGGNFERKDSQPADGTVEGEKLESA